MRISIFLFLLCAIPLSAQTPRSELARIKVENLNATDRVFLGRIEATHRYPLINRAMVIDVGPCLKGLQYHNVVRVIKAPSRPSNDPVYWEMKVSFQRGDSLTLKAFSSSDSGLRIERPMPGRLHFVVPLDTRIFINGKLTLQEGEERDFVTAPLQMGEVFPAVVKFDFRNRVGRRVIRTKTYSLSAGSYFEIRNIEALAEEIVPEPKGAKP